MTSTPTRSARSIPKIKRRVSGYNLHQLLPENGFNVARALVGSEGTCALTLQAKTRLVHSPQGRVLLVLGFADIYLAGDIVPQVLPFKPIATEGLDLRIIGGMRERGLRLDDIALLPHGNAWLLVEFGAATREEAAIRARELMQALEHQADAPSMKLFEEPKLAHRIWTMRETGASATALSLDRSEPDPVIGWEDAAVDPSQLGIICASFRSSSTATVTRPRSTGISATAAFMRASSSICGPTKACASGASS